MLVTESKYIYSYEGGIQIENKSPTNLIKPHKFNKRYKKNTPKNAKCPARKSIRTGHFKLAKLLRSEIARYARS